MLNAFEGAIYSLRTVDICESGLELPVQWGVLKDLIYISDNMQIKAGAPITQYTHYQRQMLTVLYTRLQRFVIAAYLPKD